MANAVKNKLLKWWQKWRHMGVSAKIFMIVSFIQFIFVFVGAILNIVYNFLPNDISGPSSYSSLVLTIALMIGVIVVLVYAIDAVWNENEFQLIAFNMVTILLTLAVGVNFVIRMRGVLDNWNRKEYFQFFYQTLMVAIPAFVAFIAEILYVILLIPVFRSFGWKIFKIVGADPQLRKYYRIYHIFASLLKGDWALNLIVVCMNFFFMRYEVSVFAFISYFGVLLLFLYSIVFVPIGMYAGTQRENYCAQITYIISGFISIAYLLFKIIHTAVAGSNSYIDIFSMLPESQRKEWFIDGTNVIVSIIVVNACSIIVRLLTLSFAIAVCVNFKKGLKHVFEHRRRKRMQSQNGGMVSIEALLGPEYKMEDVVESATSAPGSFKKRKWQVEDSIPNASL